MKAKNLQTLFETIRSNKAFELFVIGVIIFSALVIGVKTYPIPDSITKLVVILDWLITLIFLFEITIRFIAEPIKRNFFKNGWNLFDTTIVVVSLIPIEDSELAIIGRLIRIFRVLRMISIIPELRMLLNSLLKALPRLGYVTLLLFIIFYIYAAIGATFFNAINPVLWGDIARSMLTLFRVMTFEDWTDVMYETMEVYPFSWAFYLTFIFLTAFAFLNMIIGIVVNVLEQEHREQNRLDGEPTLQELRDEIRALKVLISAKL
ncbi:MAG: ion transporter [Pseudomonadota bacterium]